ncbi:protein terminal ear1 homolog isoform X2 [Aristolochia californica]|uniref:protein terminal ear1 homolog isoform X2 n=1 Tax=Aristolochia californica TaxID=171875 RepID=UPI0035DBFC51
MEGGNTVRLDPGAEEFWPRTTQTLHNQFALVHPQIYYPYQTTGLQVVPFYEECAAYQPSPSPSPGGVARPCGAATRAVLLSSVSAHLSEGQVRKELAVFGAVRAVEMERLAAEGVVVVHFYDLRDAQAAVGEIQQQHMRQQSRLGLQYSLLMQNWRSEEVVVPPASGRGLVGGRAAWAQFAVQTVVGPDALNQGTIVVFNLDSDVSANDLKAIFEVYGPVKELRETPYKRQHRFIEFFDVRDAGRALSEMNGKEVFGKRLMIEFSRPGGQARRSFNAPAPSSSSSAANKSSYNHGSSSFITPSSSSQRVHQGSSDSSLRLPRTLYPTNKSNNRLDDSSSRKSRNFHPSSAQPKQPNRRSSKTHKKRVENNLIFMEESNSTDTRTTVMIKNIPNKYSQKLFLNMLDNHCIHFNEQIAKGDEEPMSSYDFVYLPIDFNNKCNVGYGFVNLTSPEAAWRLYRSFHNQPWEVFNSRKICEVTYARLQGLEALKEHFRNSKFACDTDEFLPVVLSPPRDGKRLTEPVPVDCHSMDDCPKVIGRTESRVDSSTTVPPGEDDEDEEAAAESHVDVEVGEEEVVRSRLSEVVFTTTTNSCSLSTEAQQQPRALSCAHSVFRGSNDGFTHRKPPYLPLYESGRKTESLVLLKRRAGKDS